MTRLPLKHILLGLTIRELLAPWTGHPYDFEVWTRVGFYMQTLASPYRTLDYVPGLSFSLFQTTGSIGYPPLAAFMFALTYRLYFILGEPTRFLYYFLLKQPMIFADIGVAVFIAKILLVSANTKSARIGFLVWLYLPLGIIISSVWGQLDPISLFLTLVSVYFFLSSRYFLSALMLGLSIYLKMIPVIFLAVLLIQPAIGITTRLRYSLVALAIPIVGTLTPAIILDWNLQAMYNYLAFQAAVPVTGEMSILGIFHSIPALSGIAQYLTPFLWIPVLLAGYFYISRRNLPMMQGLLIATLAFTVSRPWVSEQYAIYPLAFLLVRNSKASMGHFLGLALASTLFLAANNTLLVPFSAPLFPRLFQWNYYPWNIFIISPPPYAALRSIVMSLSALVYFAESLLVLLSRESLVYRLGIFARPRLTFLGRATLIRLKQVQTSFWSPGDSNSPFMGQKKSSVQS